ncbi:MULTISPECIES: hypothetical protein [unclassified Rhizobium]|uniref:hypothetical protein n=1 Tax=unclassified Rhizobium TaxID=2613769 RepID=UPI001784BCE5|nr:MULTISPECIES: hypothetical protein [unclassified Rhizobium]MBD8685968.1 hypothetical protein [Rhizobium sp. CFBP 13644]MBD8690359.1 hypothetical protein [Rhizobium sp. CFBP 13717]
MRAPIRSHGFDKPSDLEDELSQLDDNAGATRESANTGARASGLSSSDVSLHEQINDIRREMAAIRSDVEQLQAAASRNSGASGHGSDVSTWLPIVRSVAITSLAGRIFASSPIMALLVAAVPFALGLSAGSK